MVILPPQLCLVVVYPDILKYIYGSRMPPSFRCCSLAFFLRIPAVRPKIPPFPTFHSFAELASCIRIFIILYNLFDTFYSHFTFHYNDRVCVCLVAFFLFTQALQVNSDSGDVYRVYYTILYYTSTPSSAISSALSISYNIPSFLVSLSLLLSLSSFSWVLLCQPIIS